VQKPVLGLVGYGSDSSDNEDDDIDDQANSNSNGHQEKSLNFITSNAQDCESDSEDEESLKNKINYDDDDDDDDNQKINSMSKRFKSNDYTESEIHNNQIDFSYKHDHLDEEDDDSIDPNIDNTAQPVRAQSAIDRDALMKLMGGKKSKKKFEDEMLQMRDVSVSEIVGDNKAELMKQITSEYRPPSNKDYFATSSRRSHQITYLAKVAQERDAELRNMWSQDKFNKRMSRQRYGF
jgi:hypothetical protein